MAHAHPELAGARAALLVELNHLLGRVRAHNARCSAVDEGSDAERSCRVVLDELSGAVSRHTEHTEHFISTVQAGEQRVLKILPGELPAAI